MSGPVVGGQLLLNLRCIGPFYRRVTGGDLPDVVLLEIFDFYLEEEYDEDYWHTLVHVCRRWRNVVFSSPHRLNLKLRCESGRPVTEMFNIWPELPIAVSYYGEDEVDTDTDNIIAALNLRGSVSRINLTINSRSAEWETFAAVMQDPFPMLEELTLESYYDTMLVISDSFLGGSAPCLQRLCLHHDIVFPALPNLLLSANDLIHLDLRDIPHSGYISPEAMVTCISVLTRLESLSLAFRSPRSRPDRAGKFLPPLTRTLLPALTHLEFKGVTEYLEDLVARIDVPLLKYTNITFFNHLVFDMLQFPNLVHRTEKFTVTDQARICLQGNIISIVLSPKVETVDFIWLRLVVSCRKLDWQLSALAQVCNSCLPTLPSLERLSIHDDQYPSPDWQDDMENTQWLELLRPFTAVKDLYLSEEVALHVAPVLQELFEEQVTEVLPALQDIFIGGLQSSGFVQEVFQKFVAARGRQVSGHPVAIHGWVGREGW